jgi:dolichyl-phosphate-mannose-protein mannosyltransferase
VHPPHGKLLIALGAKLGGFDGSFTFDHIGQPYGDQPVMALRFMPALAGTLIPLVFYFFLLELRASRPSRSLGAIDRARQRLLTDTRIIVFDGISWRPRSARWPAFWRHSGSQESAGV